MQPKPRPWCLLMPFVHKGSERSLQVTTRTMQPHVRYSCDWDFRIHTTSSIHLLALCIRPTDWRSTKSTPSYSVRDFSSIQ
jgi:hypothetical protein